MFTMKYGSIVVMERMTYAEALPLYGLRQNVFTDPQKPMRVEPGDVYKRQMLTRTQTWDWLLDLMRRL